VTEALAANKYLSSLTLAGMVLTVYIRALFKRPSLEVQFTSADRNSAFLTLLAELVLLYFSSFALEGLLIVVLLLWQAAAVQLYDDSLSFVRIENNKENFLGVTGPI
jgi:hypothetical protein